MNAPGGRNYKRTALAVAAMAASTYFFLRVLPCKLVSALMYMPRPYNDELVKRWLSAGDLWPGYTLQAHAYGPRKWESCFILHPRGFWDTTRKQRNFWLVYGGNAMVALEWVSLVKAWSEGRPRREDIEGDSPAFILIDYPSYGLSAGADDAPAPDSETIVATTQAVVNSIREKHNGILRKADDSAYAAVRSFDTDASKGSGLDLIFNGLGHSIGCAALLHYASSEARKPGGAVLSNLILSAPFMSIPHVGQKLLPQLLPALGYLPFSVYERLTPPEQRWNNLRAAARLPPQTRIALIHGVNDEICEFHHGKRVHAVVEERMRKLGRPPPEFKMSLTAGHNDLLEIEKSWYAEQIFSVSPKFTVEGQVRATTEVSEDEGSNARSSPSKKENREVQVGKPANDNVRTRNKTLSTSNDDPTENNKDSSL
ncbi:unnamed protein product [Amoebophrya sp. A25]|nr:unnamed protein product [Amoebophrya sp. A25]|eukprot:GSA25T00015210001.1